MAITTAAKRQAALVDAAGMLFPDGTIGTADRSYLLGQYYEAGSASTVYTNRDFIGDQNSEGPIRVSRSFVKV